MTRHPRNVARHRPLVLLEVAAPALACRIHSDGTQDDLALVCRPGIQEEVAIVRSRKRDIDRGEVRECEEREARVDGGSVHVGNDRALCRDSPQIERPTSFVRHQREQVKVGLYRPNPNLSTAIDYEWDGTHAFTVCTTKVVLLALPLFDRSARTRIPLFEVDKLTEEFE
jgi:hypothetical protein